MMSYNDKVLLVLEETFETDGIKFSSNSSWTNFALMFLKNFKQAYIYVPLKNVSRCTRQNSFILPPTITIVGRPYYDSFKDYYIGLFKNHIQYQELTNKYVSNVDVVIVRAPSQVSKYVINAVQKYNKKLIVVYATNFMKASKPLNSKNNFLKTYFYKFAANIIENNQVRLAQESDFMVLYGKELERVYGKYNKNYILSNTPTISKYELFYRKDTCTESEIRIIRVATYLPNKDYETLIKAVKVLRAKKINIVLHSYGLIEDVNYYNELLLISDVDYINLHPQVKFGPELFNKYKSSDIQIITSKSEGIPRNIVEGASFSIPLITTDVGGISTNIKDKYNGLFIEVGSYDSLVNAVLTIINDSDLRKKLIYNGFNMAKEMTIEKIATTIEEVINKVSKGEKNER